jgi:protein-disulfide isomerase
MKVRAKGSAAAVRQRAAAERAARGKRLRLIAGVGAAAVAAVVALIVIGGVLRGGDDAIEARLAPTDGFVLGSPDARVVLTVWEDFQCPVCKAANASTLERIEEEYVNTGKVQILFRQFPFLGNESTAAAEASQCAADQDAFWPYHDALFAAQGAENSGALNNGKLKSIASDLDLDMTTFNSCFDSGAHKASVQAEKEQGVDAGVTGTPAIFIDGVRVTDWRNYSAVAAMIDSALAQKS